MSKTIETYCPSCDGAFNANLCNRSDSLVIFKQKITYEATVAICPECGEIIADSRIESANQERAYETYFKQNKIMTPDEKIKQLEDKLAYKDERIKELLEDYGTCIELLTEKNAKIARLERGWMLQKCLCTTGIDVSVNRKNNYFFTCQHSREATDFCSAVRDAVKGDPDE